MTIYKIDHRYNIDPDKHALFVASDLSESEMIDVLATVQFRYEELVNDHSDIANESLLEILSTFYRIRNVTADYQAYLVATRVADTEWATITYFRVKGDGDAPVQDITLIDLYNARELSCGPKAQLLTHAPIPQSPAFIRMMSRAKSE